MTAARKKHQAQPGRHRLLLGLAAIVILAGVFCVTIDRSRLPQALQDNTAVTRFYRVRDALIGTEAAPAKDSPAAKQLGYPKDDRKKLDALIGTGEQK